MDVLDLDNQRVGAHSHCISSNLKKHLFKKLGQVLQVFVACIVVEVYKMKVFLRLFPSP